jgi:cell wall-associated NlpC family hydrolase
MIQYDDLIGVPFVYGGRDKQGLDCFGLVMEMLRRDGLNPCDYGWDNEPAAIEAMMLSARESHWREIPFQPRALLLFRTGRFVRHVAYTLSYSHFIHCWERSGGVVVEDFNEDWKRRLVGCYEYVANK